MRLTAEQKSAAVAHRPGSSLVRVASEYAVIWFEDEQPRRERWRGQLIKNVERNGEVWWSGSEVAGLTRREVVQQLNAEATL